MPRYALAGKVALVTGGARGIGLATARALVARGATVALVDLDAGAAATAAATLGAGRAAGLEADVTDRAALDAAVATTVERFGGLDVVVANAGIVSRSATFRAMNPDRFERVVDVNLLGTTRTVGAALPHVVARGGHVVVVASVYAFANGVGVTPYAVSKAGVEAFGRALRVELAQHGASATVAYFGWVDTEMVRRAVDGDPVPDRMVGRLPAPLRARIGADEAGEAIARGIERRRARVFRPRRWAAVAALRGLLNPALDAAMTRAPDSQEAARELDGRAGEEQPTTA